MRQRNEDHLDVYSDRYELHQNDNVTVYHEGFQDADAQRRYAAITRALDGHYLDKTIKTLNTIDFSELTERNQYLLRSLVEGITSEVGRALVGLAFLQLTIKSIAPGQSVRLHKGSTRRGSFSWVDGISMRTLDRNYNTPFLRKYGLLNVNRDGVFMTRSLAENYPYSKLYKAEMRGPFDEWIAIVDAIEDESMPAELGLCYLMSLLKNRSDAFNALADDVLEAANNITFRSFDDAVGFMKDFFNSTTYSARAFEVVIHGFMQAMGECGFLGDLTLIPMSQMRSANKKHGNIGDIELCDGRVIVESWDAKYGKPYLRDELEELRDKILTAPGVRIAGFVCDSKVDRRSDVVRRADEIADETGVDIQLLSFEEWIEWQTEQLRPSQKNQLADAWLIAVTESFAQRRLDIAPIDEPCDGWLNDLFQLLK